MLKLPLDDVKDLHHSSTPLLQRDIESSRALQAPFQGAKAKPGPLGLDSLLGVAAMSKKRITLLRIILIIFGLIIGTMTSVEAEIFNSVPKSPDPNRKYLFYMHGAWIEMNGLTGAHPHHGFYEYDKIVKSFSDKGFIVISEARLRKVRMGQYSRMVAGQVRILIDHGIPPGNITVIGHSKGGYMALIVASILENSKTNFVVMAGCGKKGTQFRRGYEKFLNKLATRLHGRILSIYDREDNVAGSCQESFKKAMGLQSKEVEFHTGKGHGLFYSPNYIWINEVFNWAGM